jgi:N-acetylglutamate synthase-like GNAT family acetyltransferase
MNVKLTKQPLWRKYLPEVLRIDQLCNGARALTEGEYLSRLAELKTTGFVLLSPNESVAGFVMYELRSTYILLLNLAVHPDSQRKGVGTLIVEDLKAKLTPEKYKFIVALLRDDAPTAHLFLKAMGFTATEVVHDAFFDGEADGYVFKFASQTLADEGVISVSEMDDL